MGVSCNIKASYFLKLWKDVTVCKMVILTIFHLSSVLRLLFQIQQRGTKGIAKRQPSVIFHNQIIKTAPEPETSTDSA